MSCNISECILAGTFAARTVYYRMYYVTVHYLCGLSGTVPSVSRIIKRESVIQLLYLYYTIFVYFVCNDLLSWLTSFVTYAHTHKWDPNKQLCFLCIVHGRSTLTRPTMFSQLLIHSLESGVWRVSTPTTNGSHVWMLKMSYVFQLLMGSRHKKDVVKQQSFRHHLIHDIVNSWETA